MRDPPAEADPGAAAPRSGGATQPRVAIVTGAGRGLGRAMALGLARAGIHVVATAAREAGELEALLGEAERMDGAAQVVPMLADVTREEDCQAAVDAAVGRFGRLDILVNNAGRGMAHVSRDFMTEPSRFWEVAPATWRLVIDTNVNGPFLMARCAVPWMLKARWGRIVNISMNRATMRRQGFSPYGPSKAALESATAIWAQDLAGTGVTVNALLPGGATRTGMIPADLPPAVGATLLDPTIVVAPLLWLVSAAADGVNGKRLTATRWPGADGGIGGLLEAIEPAGG